MRSHELNRVPRDLSGSPKEKKKKKRESRVRSTLHHGDSESLTACFSFFRASRSVSSYRVSSWIDGSSVQTRPADGHFTAVPLWKNKRTPSQSSPQSFSPSRARESAIATGSVCARTRRQTDDEGWEIRHPSCQPMCECRAHDLPLSPADATSIAPAS